MRSLLVSFLFIFSTHGFAQPFGSALVLNGGPNFVSIPNNTAFSLTDSVTFEAWIKPCNLTGHNLILSKFWCSGSQNAYFLTVLNGKLRWQWSLNSCSVSGNLFESNLAVIQANVWQHVAVVHTSTGVTMYLNGLPLAASLIQGAYSTLKISNQPLRIGTYKNLSGAYTLSFKGLIDEVRVWDTTLTATQIFSRYNTTLFGNEANLIAYYNMNSTGSGNGVAVLNGATATGSALNGTTVGSGTWPFFSSGLPVPDLGNDTTLCAGSSYVLDVTTTNATYLWQDFSSLPTFTVSQADTFSVDVSVSGCVNSDTVVVSYENNPTVNLGADTTLCFGQNIVLNAIKTNCTYLWQDGSTDSTFNVNQGGVYWVEVTNYCSTIVDSIIVSFVNYPIVDLGNDTTFCSGNNLLLDASYLNATYVWQDNSTNAKMSVIASGTYWVLVDYYNCVSSDTVNVIVNPSPVINLGPDTSVCDGDSLMLSAGFSASTYLWQDSSTSANYSVFSQGQYSVTVSLGSCGYSDTIIVNYNPYPTVDLGNDTMICQGLSFLIFPNNSGGTYNWQDGSNQSYFQVNTSGVYWVQVVKNGCMTVDTISVGNLLFPMVSLSNDTSICATDSLVLEANSLNATYLWSDSSTSNSIVVNAVGTYWVQATNNCGSARDVINITHVQIPTVDLGEDVTLCEFQRSEINLEGIGANLYWNDGSTTTYYMLEDSGVVWVKVYNDCGFNTDSILVNVENCHCDFFIPNSFTPNGDNLNDIFIPKSECLVLGYYFTIVDRWGNEVFASENPNYGWDGTYLGKPVANAVFSYIIKYSYRKGGKQTPYQTLHGKVTVVR